MLWLVEGGFSTHEHFLFLKPLIRVNKLNVTGDLGDGVPKGVQRDFRLLRRSYFRSSEEDWVDVSNSLLFVILKELKEGFTYSCFVDSGCGEEVRSVLHSKWHFSDSVRATGHDASFSSPDVKHLGL